MAKAQIQNNNAAATVRSRAQYRVLLKRKWSEKWVEKFWLQPVEAELAAAPRTGKARLRYDFGEIKREEFMFFGLYFRPALVNQFVKIETIAEGPDERPVVLWFGLIVDEEADLQAPNPTISGTADYIGFTLDHLLDRKGIEQSVKDVAHVSGTDPEWVWADRVPKVNQRPGAGRQAQGNRSSQKFTNPDDPAGRQSYVFSHEANLWTAKDLAEYLLTWHGPGAAGDEPTVEITGATDVLDRIVPTGLTLEGRTVKAILDELIDRRRGLGYDVRLVSQQDGSEVLRLHVWKVFDQQIPGIDIEPNRDTVRVDAANRSDFRTATLTTTAAARYSSIVVRGAPVLVVYTVSVNDVTLVHGWSNDDEDIYKTAADGTAEANDRFRERDEMSHVYQRFILQQKNRWKGGSGKGTGIAPVVPKINDAGLIDSGHPDLPDWGVRLERELPLERPSSAPSPENPEGAEFRPMFVLLKDEDGNYRYVEELGASVRPLDTDAGIELETSPNHLLAKNHWDAANPTEQQPKYDWFSLVATIAIETDERLRAEGKPLTDDESTRKGAETLVIDVPDAELWRAAPNVVEGVSSGALRYRSGSRDLRNDWQRINDILFLAESWYGRIRREARLEFSTVNAGLFVGQILEAVHGSWDDAPVNTVISSVSIDFEKAETVVETQYRDLDFASIV